MNGRCFRMGVNFKPVQAMAVVLFIFGVMGAPLCYGVDVKRWHVFETSMTTSQSYSNAQKYLDVSLWVTFTGPGGTFTVPGFWDGGNTWRVRFAPTAVGSWSYTIDSSDTQLDDPSNDGTFNCITLTQQEIDDNPNYRGFLRMSANSRYLEYADGTPFFYLADTIWDGNSRNMEFEMAPYDFQAFIDDRANKRFTAMQILASDRTDTDCSPSRYTGCNEDGPLFTVTSIEPNIANFQNLDSRIAYIHDKGMVPMYFPHWGPNFNKPENELQAYYRFFIGRYQAYNMIWCMSGEYDSGGFGDFAKIDRLGNYVNDVVDGTNHPITIHPYGIATSMRDFKYANWLDIFGVQWWTHSGDGVSEMNWLYADGVQASYNNTDPFIRPVLVLESNYGEQDGSRQRRIRRSAWVCVQGGCFGYTHGHHGIWNWDTQANSGLTVMGYSASTWMTHLHDFYTGIEWWKLSPRNDLTAAHGGVAYCTADVGAQYVVYLMETNSIDLNLSGQSGTASVKWFNVETGQYQDGGSIAGGSTHTLTSPFGNESVVYVAFPTIAAPSNVTATVEAGPEVHLTWDDNSSDPEEDHFIVQRRPFGGQDNWHTLDTLPQGTTNYTDTDGLYGMVEYRYRVGAYRD